MECFGPSISRSRYLIDLVKQAPIRKRKSHPFLSDLPRRPRSKKKGKWRRIEWSGREKGKKKRGKGERFEREIQERERECVCVCV